MLPQWQHSHHEAITECPYVHCCLRFYLLFVFLLSWASYLRELLSMTSYITLIVVFLTTLAGIVGHTWNSHRKGFRRLTLTGWTVLLLALAALVVGVIESHRKDVELRNVYAIRQVANRQVLEATSYL